MYSTLDTACVAAYTGVMENTKTTQTPEEGAMTITAIQPTETGALAGFTTTCPRCGMVLTNTLESSLQIDASQHLDWHDGQEG